MYIAAHVPPGVFELSPRFQWFHADLNTEYLEVIADYGEVIEAQFYGHEHTDSFRIFGSSSKSYLCVDAAVGLIACYCYLLPDYK